MKRHHTQAAAEVDDLYLCNQIGCAHEYLQREEVWCQTSIRDNDSCQSRLLVLNEKDPQPPSYKNTDIAAAGRMKGPGVWTAGLPDSRVVRTC